MRVETQIFDEVNQCYKIVFVNKEEPKTKKPKRFRGKNKVANFKDKAEQKKKDAQLYKRGTVWTKSQQADRTHAMRQCHNTLTKLIHLESQGLLDTI